MSKEYLEAFEILLQHIETEADWSDYEKVKNAHKIVEQSLKRLESIDNSTPSEALTYIDAFIEENNNDIKNQDITGFDIDTQAKWVKYLEHKSVMFSTIKQALLKAQDNARSEEILQKYYQEGITLDSVRALKQERDNYKKVLEIIKEKDVDIYILTKCKTVDEYNFKIVHIVGETRELTKEEFETIKEVIK